MESAGFECAAKARKREGRREEEKTECFCLSSSRLSSRYRVFVAHFFDDRIL
jgi:hypothetical protein